MEKFKNQIPEDQYKEAKQIIDLYERMEKHEKFLNALPMLEEGMILEYKDLIGGWYEYTEQLQQNYMFHPDKLRVILKNQNNEIHNCIIKV